MIKTIALDVANTLLHKPGVFTVFEQVLKDHGIYVPKTELERNHKLLSEAIAFPDVTGEDFYNRFNSEVMLSVGVIPTEKILEQLYLNCRTVSWEAFQDTRVLNSLNTPLVIFSNFNNSLPTLLASHFDTHFQHIVVSETLGVAKPSSEFYHQAVERVQLKPEEILYVGDSLKLDIIPARNLGMQTLLIDRTSFYPNFNERITTLEALLNYLP